MNIKDTLDKPLPELEEQIQFMRKVWTTVGTDDGQVSITKKDFEMMEAILGSLCAVKYIVRT